MQDEPRSPIISNRLLPTTLSSLPVTVIICTQKTMQEKGILYNNKEIVIMMMMMM